MGELIMLIGLAGAGKSEVAAKYKEQGYRIHASDDLRLEIYGDINDTTHHQQVFEELERRIISDLKDGLNVVYDATNLCRKRRKAFLSKLHDIDCHKKAIDVHTDYFVCLQRNSVRERTIPPKVITKQWQSYQPPWTYEGWDEIEIVYDSDQYPTYELYTFLMDTLEFDQDNKHHDLKLGQHSIAVNNYLGDSPRLIKLAAYLHDEGKQWTRSRCRPDGSVDKESHYYGHDNVGAYNSLFYLYQLDISEKDKLYVANLISWHMKPFVWEKSEKSRKHDLQLIGDVMYNDIMELHSADVSDKEVKCLIW